MSSAAAKHGSADSISELAVKAIGQILHPSPTRWQRLFTWAGIVFVTAAFLAILFISAPFAPTSVTCTAGLVAIYLTGAKEAAAHLCDWIALISQMAIILFIGGAAFTESFANLVKREAENLRNASLKAQIDQNDVRSKALTHACNSLIHISQKKGSTGKKISEAAAAFRVIFDDTRTFSTRYVWFAAKGLVLNFPGGLYGFLGLVFLSIQVLAVSTKIMLDYLPSSCGT
jgi:hypothetical protein